MNNIYHTTQFKLYWYMLCNITIFHIVHNIQTWLHMCLQEIDETNFRNYKMLVKIYTIYACTHKICCPLPYAYKLYLLKHRFSTVVLMFHIKYYPAYKNDICTYYVRTYKQLVLTTKHFYYHEPK